ncbi:MAG TPA: monovalent cation/H+ antiporter subunit D family protein [Burkholderiales bacterium]|jgi:multicomponent Na+:H+ antiporter subunit D|nr:monovalent cation/H+ antiporter subunit D family protein [Burkholderiales bacterium]
MIYAHLPALQVALPLIAAPLCVLLRRGFAAWLLALVVTWVSAAIAVALLLQVLHTGAVSYLLGSWAAPWGIEYRVDVVNAFVLVLVSGIASVVVPYARASVGFEIPVEQQYLFWTAYLLCLAGLLGIAITGDAFNVFVFLEISSLATYILIALGRDRRALVASYQYLIMGTIGATFIVIGVGLLYLMTGTLNLSDLSNRITAVGHARPQLAALAFLTVGISLKLALFPLHLWLPNAYAYAPSAATAFLAATATKVAVYLLLRFYFSVFGHSLVFAHLPLPQVLLALSVAAMFVASTVAIFQQDVKRMFAYSSVAQIGYITLGTSFASATGLTGGIVHLFNHAVAKGSIFLLLGCVALRIGQPTVARMAGLGKRMPWTAAGLTIGGLSLIGIPGTVGFVSKWYLVLAALERGWWWLAAAILASTLLAIVYVWRLIETCYLREPPPRAEGVREAPLSMLIPALLLAAACVFFGLDTSVTVGTAAQAARTLLENVR